MLIYIHITVSSLVVRHHSSNDDVTHSGSKTIQTISQLQRMLVVHVPDPLHHTQLDPDAIPEGATLQLVGLVVSTLCRLDLTVQQTQLGAGQLEFDVNFANTFLQRRK